MMQVIVHVLKDPIVKHSAIQIYENCSCDARNLYLLMLDDIYYGSSLMNKSVRNDIQLKINNSSIRNILLEELVKNKLVNLTVHGV